MNAAAPGRQMNRNSERIPRPAGAGLRGERTNIKIRLKVLTVEVSLQLVRA
jgi:hypothetical protein